MSSSHKHCYASLTSPSMTDAINLHNFSALKLSVLVAEFAQQMAAAHEHFSKEIQSVIATFRRRNYDLNKERPVEQPSTIFKAWECLLQESEMDAQAHLDAASLLIKNVYKPLEMVASYKSSQAQKLCSFRDNFENILSKSENSLQQAERGYYDTYETFSGCTSAQGREAAKKEMYNAHNDYVLQLRASNKIVDKFHEVIPQVLEELEEIFIDTSNTINVAIESHALLLLTKAKEQHRRYDDLLKICRQVSPHVDISHFVKTMCQEQGAPNTYIHHFQPADLSVSTTEVAMKNQLIIDGYTEPIMNHKRKELQREAVELASFIKHSQDVTTSLISICQRNLANHMYAKVYETQEDLCHKRNEIRVANMQLAGVRAQRAFFLVRKIQSKDLLMETPCATPSTCLTLETNATPSTSVTLETNATPSTCVSLETHATPSTCVTLETNATPSTCVTLETNATQSTSVTLETNATPSTCVTLETNANPSTCVTLETNATQSTSVTLETNATPSTCVTLETNANPSTCVTLETNATQSTSVTLETYATPSTCVTLETNATPSTCVSLETHATQSTSVTLETNATPSTCVNMETKGDMNEPKDGWNNFVQMDMVMPKQNGSVVEGVDQQEEESDMKHSQSSSAIKGMWKKAFKNLKSNEKQTSLKKGSLRRKDSKDQEEEESEERDEIDPVYSLLKCAADLPKASKVCGIHSQCSGHHSKHGGHGDSSASTSKTSSPSSSASHSPKTRRKKLNARMKSFSLDTPDPPKQLLGIDETTKKKSSSFTNTCFGAPNSPVDTMTSTSYRKKLGFSHRSSSLEIEERKHRSHTPSPLQSPKSKRKDTDVYVVLYNFKGKEKDDMDLRAGWKLSLINSSDPDWWKGRCNGKVGYFPATYVQRLVPGQRVFQVTHTMNLSEGDNGMRLHKDQIVVQVGEEVNGMIHVQAPNKKQAMCPLKYLQEL